ncbi:hypothetical protein BKA63DRAFT_569734 [Paraphoma chrysanthemicola]|nr:hypothetical protein BKA63DRAFT_569734 [Paraphoma chrysanthemicola]
MEPPLLALVTNYAVEHFQEAFASLLIPPFLTDVTIADDGSRPFMTYVVRQRGRSILADVRNLREVFQEYDISYTQPFNILCPPGPRTAEQYENLEAILRYYFLVKGNEEPLTYWNRVGDPEGFGDVFCRTCFIVREAMEDLFRDRQEERLNSPTYENGDLQSQNHINETERQVFRAVDDIYESSDTEGSNGRLAARERPATPTPQYIATIQRQQLLESPYTEYNDSSIALDPNTPIRATAHNIIAPTGESQAQNERDTFRRLIGGFQERLDLSRSHEEEEMT